MSRLTLETCSSLPDLRRLASAWDDLWLRSDVAVPVLRAETLADWVEAFCPRMPFQALMVIDGGQPVAGLALFRRNVGCILPAAKLANNEWCDCGDLLVDPQTDVPAALDRLVQGIAALPTPLCWFDPINLDAARWGWLVDAARRRQFDVVEQPKEETGVVRIEGSWSDYEASWSGNHRRHMRKAAKRAERAGKLELKVYDRLGQPEVRELLRRGFEIEDRSWKGTAGSSVLRSPGMFDFFVAQAEQLAAWGQLRLIFLEFDGRPIAFELGYAAKGTYFTLKVGYDSTFAEMSPGQLLRYRLFERFFAEREMQTVDFWGPLTEATAKWSTDRYRVGRLILAAPTWSGRSAMAAYRLAGRALRTARVLRGRAAPAAAESASALPDEPELSLASR